MAQVTGDPCGTGGKIIPLLLEALWRSGAKTFKKLIQFIPPALPGWITGVHGGIYGSEQSENKEDPPCVFFPMLVALFWDLHKTKKKAKSRDREGEREENNNRRGSLEGKDCSTKFLESTFQGSNFLIMKNKLLQQWSKGKAESLFGF